MTTQQNKKQYIDLSYNTDYLQLSLLWSEQEVKTFEVVKQKEGYIQTYAYTFVEVY